MTPVSASRETSHTVRRQYAAQSRTRSERSFARRSRAPKPSMLIDCCTSLAQVSQTTVNSRRGPAGCLSPRTAVA